MKNIKSVLLFIILNATCFFGIYLDAKILLVSDVSQNSIILLICSLLSLLIIVNLIIILIYKKNKKIDQQQKRFITDSIHSLRTPLTIITANADLLEYDKNIEYVNNIRNEVDKIEKLTSNLMNYSMLKENEFMKSEDFIISNVLNEECLKVKLLFDKLKIKFNYNIEKDVVWHANSGRIMILINTLLENSSKYCKYEVECNLTTNYLEIINDTTLKDGNYLHLFERFRRSNSNTKGFGVGLSIVKLISEAYNIKLEADVINGKMIIRLNKKCK